MTIHIHYTGLLQVIGLNECEDCTGEVGSLEICFSSCLDINFSHSSRIRESWGWGDIAWKEEKPSNKYGVWSRHNFSLYNQTGFLIKSKTDTKKGASHLEEPKSENSNIWWYFSYLFVLSSYSLGAPRSITNWSADELFPRTSILSI